MSTSLFTRFAGAALSAVVILSSAACATPNRGGGGGGASTANPGTKGGAGTTGIHSGIMGSGAGGGGTAAGGMNRMGSRADLGQELSAFIAGLAGIGHGGTAGGGGGTMGGVGVSTLVLGNVAFVGIDTATLHGGNMGGMTGGGGDMETRIRSSVRSAYPQIADVVITTSPVMVFRIARVTSDLQAGLPGTYRLTEMFSIAQAMSPGTDPGARSR